MSETEKPKFELQLIGPTADDDVRRLVARYGNDEVLAAVKRVTSKKRGRRPDQDWHRLLPFYDLDSEDVLVGIDYRSVRPNIRIAEQIASEFGKRARASVHRKIMRKLSVDRDFWAAHLAYRNSFDLPMEQHLRAVRAIRKANNDDPNTIAERLALADIEAYRARSGEPDPSMSIFQIRQSNLEVNRLSTMLNPKLRGLFGRGLVGSILKSE